METPIYTRLCGYHRQGRVPFAMPGHKDMRGLAPDLALCDVTELRATVDLHHEDEYTARANELLSALYGAKRSFIMTGGSTAGVMAMLLSVLRPGDTLAAAANCHGSVINACALFGYKLVVIPEFTDKDFFVPRGIDISKLPEDAAALVVSSPNYYGITEDIERLSGICRERGIPLLADEAHGAHFAGGPGLPASAVSLGADMVCQSAHKTLNALTGAAYMHVCSDRIDIRKVRRALCAVQTSSPSYPIAASADAARATISETDYGNIIRECRDFCEAVENVTRIKILKNDDPTRMVLNFSEYEISGCEAAALLSERYGIDAEMGDAVNVVLIATPWNTHADFAALFRALREMTGSFSPRVSECAAPVCGDVIKADPSSAWYGESEPVPAEMAAGRIAAETVTAYPPGTALTVPGAEITEDMVSAVCAMQKAGAEMTGLCGGCVRVLRKGGR